MERQIATTKEQSARLLKCGVPAESADMHWYGAIVPRGGSLTSMPEPSEEWDLGATPYGCMPEELQKAKLMEDYNEIAPAWSLSALLGFLPKVIEEDESSYDEVQKFGLLIYPYMGGWQVDYQCCEDDECYCLKCVHGTDLIEACVQLIEWLTANGYKLNGIEKGGEA